VAGSSSPGSWFLVSLRHFIVELTFGDRYAPAADLMPLLCVAMAAMALVGFC
jgi:O-antigen/teichoic acid export membrane protein